MKRSFAVVLFSLVGVLPADERDCTELLLPSLQRQADEVEELEAEYRQTLGIFANLFDFVLSAEEGDRLFARLAIRQWGDDWVESPLGAINRELKRIHAGSYDYNPEMAESIVADIRSSLGNPEMERMDLQGNLLALWYVREYLRKFDDGAEVVDRDGEKIPEPERPGQSEGVDKPEKGEPPPPEYPEMPDSYKPFTKELSQGGGDQTPHRVVEANFKTGFFVGKRYGEISRHSPMPFQVGILPVAPGQPGKFKETSKEMLVRTFGKREVALFLPSGHRPLQPSDARASIVTEDSGVHTLRLKGDLSRVVVPLVEESGADGMVPLLEYYSRPVGFAENEWPEKIRAEVLRRFPPGEGKTQPLKVADALAGHISKEYLYSVGSRLETDPIEALKAGAFQCDMAAYIMTAVLRDFYQIPARAVGGYPAQKYKGGADQKSYLTLPGEAHAWVEVLHDGRWHTFDPTPVMRDRKEPDSGNNSEYSPWEGESAGEADSPSQGRSSGEGEKAGDHASRLEQNTREGLEKNRRVGGEAELPEVAGEEAGLGLKDLADRLELGSLELEPIHDNPLTARAMRVFLQGTLDPRRRGEDVQNLLNGMLEGSRKFPIPQFQQLYREALDAHASHHPGLNDWIDQLVAMMPKQELDKTHQEMFALISGLRIYGRVLDGDGAVPYPGKLLDSLDEAYRLINSRVHPDAGDIGIVKDLTRNLPNLALQLLKRRYDLASVGPNAPTRKVAKKLKQGVLNDLRLMAILNPLTDFILNATPRPESIPVKKWEKNFRRILGRDLLPLDRPSDIARALIGRPDLPLEENIRLGSAFVPGRRQVAHISGSHGKEEAERVTIVLYDTSGSMFGSPGQFQAGLISSFTAKALSDLSPSGRHRHRVVLVPFDSKPGTPVPVTNAAEGLDVIDNYHKNLANTGGGTDIQSALMQGMALIADAEKRGGEPLAAANIILMTDGIDDGIDTGELYRARVAIDRRTPLQVMFIAIGETNPVLMNFAMDSRSAGMEKGFYREFRGDLIGDILREASDSNFGGGDHFYTDTKPEEISGEWAGIMESARSEAITFTRLIGSRHHTSARDNLDNLRKIKWHNITDMDRPLEKWLIGLRLFAGTPIFRDRRLLEPIADDLLVNFERLAGVDLNALGDHEQEQLRHFLRYAAGLEDTAP